MPFVQVKTNAKLTLNDEISIKSELGKLIKIIPGKSESWLMIDIKDEEKMYFKGSEEKCAMIEVMLYGGASDSSLNEFTGEVTDFISKTLAIDASRIYVSYFLTDKWGYAGSNF